MPKKKENGSKEKVTAADDVMKQGDSADGSKHQTENRKDTRQKNSRDSKLDKRQSLSSDREERQSQKQEHTEHSRESGKRKSTSLQNQSANSGTRDARVSKDDKNAGLRSRNGTAHTKTGTAHTENGNVQTKNGSAHIKNGTAHTKNGSAHTEHGTVRTENGHEGSSSQPVTPELESLNRYNFDWSNFTYKPTEYVENKNPRVVLATGPEPCSCYPVTSKKTVSSMLYDEIRCIHCNDIGITQANVIRFDDGWDNTCKTLKEESFQVRSKSLFLGYPRPQFTDYVYDDVSFKTIADDSQSTSQNDDASSILTPMSRMELRGSNSPESKAPSIGDMPFRIPRLGYTPQPASRQTQLCSREGNVSNRDNNVIVRKDRSLPGSSKSETSDRHSVQHGQVGAPKAINTTRTFRVKYFDNVTGKVFEYEINPDYQRDANGWQTKRELSQYNQ